MRSGFTGLVLKVDFATERLADIEAFAPCIRKLQSPVRGIQRLGKTAVASGITPPQECAGQWGSCRRKSGLHALQIPRPFGHRVISQRIIAQVCGSNTHAMLVPASKYSVAGFPRHPATARSLRAHPRFESKRCRGYNAQMRGAGVGLKRHSGNAGNCLVHTSLLEKCHAEVIIERRRYRAVLQSLPVNSDCFINTPLLIKRGAEVVASEIIPRGAIQRVTENGLAIAPVRCLHARAHDQYSRRQDGCDTGQDSRQTKAGA